MDSKYLSNANLSLATCTRPPIVRPQIPESMIGPLQFRLELQAVPPQCS